jgi:PAS domain S-box-containing protein
MMTPQDVSRLQRIHGAVLALLMVLLAAGQVYLQRRLAIHTEDAHLINLAGRQRMLSQRLAKNAALCVTGHLGSSLCPPLLRADTGEVESQHLSLFATAEQHEAFDAGVRAQLTEVGQLIGLLAGAARTLAGSFEHGAGDQEAFGQMLAIEPRFLTAMDALVDRLEKQVAQEQAVIRWQQFSLVLATVLALALESLLVFRPLVRATRASMEETERSAREARGAEGRLRAILEATRDGILLLDGDHRISFANLAAAQLFGRMPGEVLGLDLRELVPGVQQTSLKPDLAPLELAGHHRDGRRVDLELSVGKPIDDEGGSVTVVLRDVGERQDRERELLRAKATAEAANHAKSDFLATMSHEIRTPLNAVLGMGGLLLETALNHEQLDYARVIRSSAEGLLMLINDILDFSKIESGKLELEPLGFRLQALLEESLELFALTAGDKGIELAYRIQPGAPAGLCADAGRIRQVLVNLLSNAMKFTERGEVTVRAEVAVIDPDEPTERGELRLSVRDTGCGIPADRVHRLFEPFQQVDASTTRKYGGTGLGLAICRRLCERMGGRIWIETEENVGTTFHVRLPVEFTEVTVQRTTVMPPLDGRRVLVIEDHEMTREGLVDQIKEWGAEARGVGSLTAATRALAGGEPFDAVVLDAMMPPLARDEARRLRTSLGARPRLVLLTPLGHAPSGEPDNPFRVKDTVTVSKPARSSHLYEALAMVFAHPEGTAAPVSPFRAEDPERAAHHPLRILVADDNPVNQMVTLKMLQRMGYVADVVSDGEEAVKAAQRKRYDLILMDVQMPRLDGLEATRQILAAPSPRSPRIVALTANAFTEDRRACLEAGMTDFLTKPIQSSALRKIVEQTPSGATKATVTSAPSSTAVLDVTTWRQLVEMNEGDPGFLRDLVRTFREACTTQLDAVSIALENSDARAYRFAAHRLKGAAAMIGAMALMKACGALEEADTQTAAQGQSLAGVVKLETQRALLALEKKLEAELGAQA